MLENRNNKKTNLFLFHDDIFDKNAQNILSHLKLDLLGVLKLA